MKTTRPYPLAIAFATILLLLCACSSAPEPSESPQPATIVAGTKTFGNLELTTVIPSPTPAAQPLLPPRCSSTRTVSNNLVTNGSFEQGRTGWALQSSGTGSTWREHPLIGSGAPFHPYQGNAAARLGGYEGSADRLRTQQPITIPTDGQLSFWWQINQPRLSSRFVVSLVPPDDPAPITLATHNDRDAPSGWQQDCIDLSSYAGEPYFVEFYVHNDNYTMTAFDVDQIVLGPVTATE
jgi:hypothetical protein